MMKRSLVVTVAVSVFGLFAEAIVPAVDYTPDWYSVDEVRTGKHATVVDVTFYHNPGSWVCLSSNTFLRDRATNTEYKLVKADGIALNEQVTMDKSGHLKAKLYFEPVSKRVKAVDLIEVGSKVHEQTYGIHLDRKRQDYRPKPQLTVEDIYKRPGEPEAWSPPVGKQLRDEKFAVPGGSVHVIGKIDNYVPEMGSSVVVINTNNEFTGENGNGSTQVDADGNFVVDVPLDHVQAMYIHLGDFFGSAFAFPGDTVRYHATTKKRLTVNSDGDVKKEYDYEYELVDSDNPATVEINLLRPVLKDSIADLMLSPMGAYAVARQGYDMVMAYGEKVKGLTHEAVTRLAELLATLNISPKAKDILFTDLIVDVNYPLVEAAFMYGDNRRIGKIDENGKKTIEKNPDYVELDVQKYFGGQEDYIAYLWDNPYIVRDWTYLNRMEYCQLKWLLKYLAMGIDGTIIASDLTMIDVGEGLRANKSRYGWFQKFMNDQERDYGVGSDFISQLIILKGILSEINSAKPTGESLERLTAFGADAMRIVDYGVLQDYYHKALNDLAMRVAINESGKIEAEQSRKLADKSQTLAAIVAPYKDRVVYVDVWDAYCGPCRAGMINQKEILEQFKNEPLTVIYLAPENNRDACEKFLKENNIKGEHLFLSNDDDARLKADFGIQSIPFGILIKKNGEFTTKITHDLTDVFKQAIEE